MWSLKPCLCAACYFAELSHLFLTEINPNGNWILLFGAHEKRLFLANIWVFFSTGSLKKCKIYHYFSTFEMRRCMITQFYTKVGTVLTVACDRCHFSRLFRRLPGLSGKGDVTYTPGTNQGLVTIDWEPDDYCIVWSLSIKHNQTQSSWCKVGDIWTIALFINHEYRCFFPDCCILW